MSQKASVYTFKSSLSKKVSNFVKTSFFLTDKQTDINHIVLGTTTTGLNKDTFLDINTYSVYDINKLFVTQIVKD